MTSLRMFLKSRQFALSVILLAVISGVLLTQNARREIATAERREAEHLGSAVSQVSSTTKEILEFRRKSLLFLAATPPIQGIVRASANDGIDEAESSTTTLWRMRLAQIFSGFMAANEDVYQIRFIGVADGGREIVRVDRRESGIVVVSLADLQQKSRRPYFIEALKRPEGTPYISPINLNQENGRIEIPFRPTARVALPIYEPGGSPFGAVVINVDLTERLERFSQAAPAGGTMYVLNQDGDFLVHPDPARRFGFDLGRPYRWADEFKADGSRHGMRRFIGPNGPILVEEMRLARNPGDEAHYLRFVAAVPESKVTAGLLRAQARTAAWALLAGLAALVPIYLFWLAGYRGRVAVQQRERLAAIVENNPDAVVTLAPDGRVLSWNGGAQAMFGYTAKEALGQSLESLVVPPGEHSFELAELPRLLLKQGVSVRELERQTRDGQRLWVEARLTSVRGHGNRVDEVTAQFRNITESRAFREQLKALNSGLESEVQRRTAELERIGSLQHAILEHAGYAVIACDPAGIITLFNPAAERMLGYDRNEVIGQRMLTALHLPEELSARAQALRQELGRDIDPGLDALVMKSLQDGPDENDWTYVCKEGHQLPVRLAITALRAKNGEVIGHLAVAADLSDLRQRERELVEAREMALAATSAKSQFLANMSHEIRTPMNAVLGMLQLLRRTSLDFAQSDYTEKAESAAKTLLGILNDILDFSKIEAGKLTLDPHPFYVDSLLRELGVILGANVGSKEVEILYDIAPDLPQRVVGDALRIQQVLLNLAGNAVKFTDRGEVVLSAKLIARSADRLHLKFSVRDTGIGMTQEQQDRIFEGFEQAQASTTRQFGGTGLGLAISQRLVAMMGGSIQVESAPGRGSTFSFDLVVSPARTEDVADTRSIDPELHGLRVLVVDDNRSAREVLSGLTASFGWSAETAVDGREALQMVESRRRQGQNYDIVLVDWRMPAMDGWATSARIRQSTQPGKPPLIVMATAHGREALAQKMDEQKTLIDGFLVKPITASMLLDAVADARAGQGRLWTGTQSSHNTQRLRGLRVLVVEDNYTNQQVARELLVAEGAEVQVASGGLTGVDAVRRAPQSFDAVLMDIQMPDLDGYGATQRIRTELGLKQLPIIAMTANAMPSDRAACLAAGMNDHIGKPFHIDDLVAGLLKHCGRAPETPPPPGAGTSADTAAAPAASFSHEFSAAIARLGGNTRLFAREARAFGSRYQHLNEQIDQAREAGSLPALLPQLHSLKGVAATLGVDALAAAAAALEARLKSGDDGDAINRAAEALLDKLPRAINRLSEAAERLDADASPPVSGPVHSNEDLKPKLDDLQAALRKNDLAALDRWSALAGTLDLAPALKRAIDEAMDRMDFAEAHRLCGTILLDGADPAAPSGPGAQDTDTLASHSKERST